MVQAVTQTSLTLSQQVSIRCKDIIAMTKEKTALVIPNAIEIRTEGEKHFLTSFASRDKTYLMLFRIWQNALMDQVCVSINVLCCLFCNMLAQESKTQFQWICLYDTVSRHLFLSL